jgi:Flp pilus assembly protein TadG
MTTRAHEETGLIGKVLVIWLLILALLIVVALDAGSVVLTYFRLSDVAADAASDAANTWSGEHNTTAACQVAAATVQEEDPDARVAPKDGCKVDASTGEFTITLRKTAQTILAGRLGFTKDLTRVTQKETNGPTTL